MKCKNCKVTLAPYLDKCPLCGLKQEKQNDNSVYSSVVENFSTRINIIYFSRLIMKILLLSNIICMTVNLAINNKISWSLYVLGSTQYIFSYYLYYQFVLKYRPYLLPYKHLHMKCLCHIPFYYLIY